MNIPDSLAGRLAAEFENEAEVTRRLIRRLPSDKLGWSPHVKSMDLGRLAGHLVEMVGWVPMVLSTDGVDFASYPYKPKAYAGAEEILADFEEALSSALTAISETDETELSKAWTMRNGDTVYCTLPRAVIIRTWAMNHVYHHRGQLSVYLRMLDVPLPSIYGPTADEMP
jgi:uncharacterized damage-inducible protein DinB